MTYVSYRDIPFIFNIACTNTCISGWQHNAILGWGTVNATPSFEACEKDYCKHENKHAECKTHAEACASCIKQRKALTL